MATHDSFFNKRGYIIEIIFLDVYTDKIRRKTCGGIQKFFFLETTLRLGDVWDVGYRLFSYGIHEIDPFCGMFLCEISPRGSPMYHFHGTVPMDIR